MNWKKMTMATLLTAGLLAIPALAQDTSTTTTTTKTTSGHNDTNSKTKNAMKEAGQKTEDTASAAKDKVTGESKTKVDINSASKDELAGLPGMDAATAQKVVDGRPYTSKSQLVSKNVVTKDQYAKIKGDVIAKQSKSADNSGTTTTSKTTTTKTKKSKSSSATPSSGPSM